MLAQFQSLYPKGSLISELVQIFQGKYIVRASVQIEGVIRATGMAAAETVEAAEDQARNRALIVLGITTSSQGSTTFSPKPTSQVQVQPNQNPSFSKPAASTVDSFPQTEAISEEQAPLNVYAPATLPEVTNKSDTSYSQDLDQRPVTSNWEPELDTPMENWGMMPSTEPEDNPFPGISSSNVTPFTPRSYSPQEDLSSQKNKRNKKSQPVDLSDVIAKTDVELQRLGWTPDQGREYLIKTYGKRGRSLLSEEQLLDFLKYLESQPDPIAGF